MKKIISNKLSWFIILAAIVAINILASAFHIKIDLTKEKRYTINENTKDLLKQLEENVEIIVFLNGNLPSGFKKLANSTDDFLHLLKETNNAKINYEFKDAAEVMEDDERTFEDTLKALGANPINLSVQIKQGQQIQTIYPYAIIKYKNNTSLVSLYTGNKRVLSQSEINSAEALLEYQFTKAIDDLTKSEKPLVAYSYANGELTDARTYDLLQAIQPQYKLFTFNINARPAIPDTFKVLMIVKPSIQFTEDEKLKIDQYLMRGGKVICFIDNLNAEQDSLRLKPELIAYDRNLNLTDLFFKYGIRINTDLVMDLQCDFMPFGVGGSAEKSQFEFLHWNYYPLFESKNNHPINKNLGLVAGRFVNSIDTVKAEGISKTILLSTSDNSRKLGTPALISLNENRNTPEDILFNQKNIPTAVLLEGNFKSLYKNRISQQQADSLTKLGISFMPESVGDSKLIIVADGDMVLNDVSQKQGPLPMGVNLYTLGSQYVYQFANRDFLLNCLEYLTGNQALMATRNKDIVLRLLDNKKVENEKNFWQINNIAVPILLVVLSGFIYQYWRRKKYAA
jgi:ABC-2 type transport system permease protein